LLAIWRAGYVGLRPPYALHARLFRLKTQYAALSLFGALSLSGPFLLAIWRTFFVSFVIQIGHVREHAPSFHSLLPRNCIQLAAKNVSKYR
jgi:hypothetical protein